MFTDTFTHEHIGVQNDTRSVILFFRILLYECKKV
jgi:hypothetical protein